MKYIEKVIRILSFIVLILSLVGVVFIFMTKPLDNNDPIHMNFMYRFIFTYDFRIPVLMVILSLVVLLIRRTKKSALALIFSVVSLSYTVMFIYMLAETIGQIS